MNKKADTVGVHLRKARVRLALSLEEAYAKTRIHTRIIEALEEDRAEEVLNPIYVRSFIKTYSHCLGLEDDDIIKKFLSRKTEPAISQKTQPELKTMRSRINFSKFLLPIVSTISIVFLVFIIIFATTKLASSVRNMFRNSRASSTIAVAPAAQAKTAFQVIPQNEKLILKLQTKEDVWMQVKSDGEIVFRHVLPKGSTEKWEAGEKINLWLGKAEDVELFLNEQSLGSPGRGVIKNISITRDGINIGK